MFFYYSKYGGRCVSYHPYIDNGVWYFRTYNNFMTKVIFFTTFFKILIYYCIVFFILQEEREQWFEEEKAKVGGIEPRPPPPMFLGRWERRHEQETERQ